MHHKKKENSERITAWLVRRRLKLRVAPVRSRVAQFTSPTQLIHLAGMVTWLYKEGWGRSWPLTYFTYNFSISIPQLIIFICLCFVAEWLDNCRPNPKVRPFNIGVPQRASPSRPSCRRWLKRAGEGKTVRRGSSRWAPPLLKCWPREK